MVVVLAGLAWQEGDGDGDGPLNAVAAAAERTQQEPGGRSTMRAVISSPGQSQPLTMTGRMVFDAEMDRARAVLTMPRPDSGEPLKMELVGDGTTIYMRSSEFGSLPDGREWMGIDLSLGRELDGSLPANVDAKGELELLEMAGYVQELGREDVRGVPTTRYRGTIDVSEQAERLREEGGEDLASYVEEKGTPTRFEAWIDAKELVRRMRIVKSQPGEDGEGIVTVDMRMEFSYFGSVPEIDVPDSSEVFDATSFAEEEIGISGD